MWSIITTFLGGAFGGILRLAPEILKFLDAKNDRAHELNMADKQLEFLKAQGTLKIDEANVYAQRDIEQGRFNAMAAAWQAENTMLSRSAGWVNNINALIRPSVTFGVFTLWAICRLAVIVYAYKATGSIQETLTNAWTAEDAGLLSMIASFYFVGRTIDKQK